MNRLLFAVTGDPWDWSRLGWDLTLVMIYTVLGLALFAVAYLIIDKMTPFSLRKELEEDQNTALGVVIGSVFIGIAIILSSAIRG